MIDETTDNPFIVPVNTMIPGTYTFKIKVTADGGAEYISEIKSLIVYNCPKSCKPSLQINEI